MAKTPTANHNKIWLAIAAVLVAALAAGALLFDAQTDWRPPAGASDKALPVQPPVAAGAPKLPASHPPLVTATPPPGVPLRAGKVDKVDPERMFTDYRIGENSVLAIYADGDVMWFGTSGGVVRYDTAAREFKTYDSRDGLRANGILFMGKLQGRIAAGTYGGGLAMLDSTGQRWEHVTVADGLGDPFVYDAIETAGGDLWIATGAGVNRVRGGVLKDRSRWEHFNVQNTGGGLPHNRVYRISAAGDGTVWFATGAGVANFRNGAWSTWTHADGLGAPDHAGGRDLTQKPAAPGAAGAVVNPLQIAALEVTRDGKVWAGTRGGGIARFDGKSWTNLTLLDGLPSNQISSLNVDHEGRLWVGTRGGIAVFKDGRFQVLKVASVLLSQGVLSIKRTRSGDLWAGGFGGVAHIRGSALN